MLSLSATVRVAKFSSILPQIMKHTRDSARNGWLWLAALAGLGYLLYLLTPILTPFVAGSVLAYIVVPLVDGLERRRLGRTLGTLLVIVLLMLALACLLLLIVPMLIEQGQALSLRLPGLVDWAEHTLSPWLRDTLGLVWHFDTATFKRALTSNMGSLRGMLARAVPLITDQGLALFGYVSNVLLLPLVLFYLVRDWRRFTAPMAELIPRRWFAELDRIGGEIDSMLGQFLRGQLAVMVIMAGVYGCGLWAVGLESGFAIGVVAGLLVFIPYVGAAIGLLLATLAAVLQFGDLSGLLLVWLVFVLGQLLESMIITPKLVGERIGLHPLVVIFALMAFGQLFGFVGIMLALPISAVLVVLVRLGRLRYLDSRFYRRQRRTTPQGR